jgi:MYXO-CTERM domain-containing protein
VWVVLGISRSAAAATPTYYDNLAAFQVDVTDTVTDDYTNPGYVGNQGDAQMSAVLGETDYMTTGFANLNLVTGNGTYCSGCNGSFELSFTTTSMGEPEGVNGVGFYVFSHDVAQGYFAYITFADGETANIPIPAAGNFWGVSAPERIERIHIGLLDGGSTQQGYFEMDNLIIGDGFDLTPCGDGIPQDDEACDTAGESATCNANCTLPVCGDGIPNEAAGELCDDAGPSAMCNADCTAVACGDGMVNELAGEDCDDAGESATCNIDCTPAECGDGVENLTAGEQCDDSAQSPACDADCTLVVCGDGYENNTAGEYCDDGNLDDGDGCSATCTNEEIAESSSDGGESSSDGGESSSEGGETSGTDGTGATDPTTTDATDPDGSSGGDDSSGDSVSTTIDPTNNGNSDTSGGSESTASTTEESSGCGCTADPIDARGPMWSALAFFGAFVARRRRR